MDNITLLNWVNSTHTNVQCHLSQSLSMPLQCWVLGLGKKYVTNYNSSKFIHLSTICLQHPVEVARYSGWAHGLVFISRHSTTSVTLKKGFPALDYADTVKDYVQSSTLSVLCLFDSGQFIKPPWLCRKNRLNPSLRSSHPSLQICQLHCIADSFTCWFTFSAD